MEQPNTSSHTNPMKSTHITARRNHAWQKTFLGVASVLIILGITACAGGSTDAPAEDDGHISIVSSTSIWGSIAAALVSGHNNIEVKTIMNNNSDDPHDYEATAQDLATLRKADIVIGNGGGYDTWLTDHAGQATIITAIPLPTTESVTGKTEKTEGSTTNPHIWFDLDIVDSFTEELSHSINDLNPQKEISTKEIRKTTEKLRKRIDKLPKANVISTEPVAGALIQQSQLKDITPQAFAHATATESEPSAADLAEALRLVQEAAVVITNEQSQAAASTELAREAKEHKVPVVNINETPEIGESYFDYIDSALTDLEKAID